MRILTLLLLSGASMISLEGQIRSVLEYRTDPDDESARQIEMVQPGEVIIELEARPVVLRRNGNKQAAAMEIDDLIDRLETDIAKIEGRPSPSGQSSARSVADRIIRHRFQYALAGASATVDPDSIERIRDLPYVRAVHPDRTVTAFLHDSVEQIGAPVAWTEYGARGQGVVVAIIDSGVDYTHPALGGGLGEGFKVLGGRDFVNEDDDPMDDAGHGTHVAGIVAADGGGLTGVAPDATLLAFKVLDASGSGRDSWVIAGIDAALAQGADVVNMSLGRPAVSDDPVIRALENAFEGGVVFCVAAGNTGRFLDIGSPARAPNAITVGAMDRQGNVASFSSRGPVTPSAAIKPEVVAPGVDITSAVLGGKTAAHSGTSMASPHVAGVAALVLSAHPDWPPKRVRTAVIGGARPVADEVMAAGGGFVFAPDSVGTDLFPSPSNLSFGIATAATERLTRSLYLTNRSETASTIDLTIEGGQEGIVLQPSETRLEIAPGEAKRVDLELQIDHALVPAPVEGSLSFSGVIRLDGGESSVAVAWSVTRASTLRVNWTGSSDAQIRLGTESMTTSGWARDGSTDLFVGAGDASIWLTAGALTSSVQHVFLDDLDLSSTPEITISPEDAPHRIRFAGRDAFGRLLADRGNASLQELIILHPRFLSDPLGTITHVRNDQETLISDTSDEVRVLAFARAFDLDEHVTWSVSYPEVRGIHDDLDLDFDSNRWVKLPLIGRPPGHLSKPYQLLLSTVWLRVANFMLTSTSTPQSGLDEAMAARNATAWLVPSDGFDHGTTAVVEIGQWPDHLPISVPFDPYLRAQFSGVEGGAVPGRATAAGLSDHIFESGEPVVIGSGPTTPSLHIGGFDTTVSATLRWFGPNQEYRIGDAELTSAALHDESGALVAAVEGDPMALSTGAFAFATEVPPAAAYRFEATSESFDIAGIPAVGTIDVRFHMIAEDTSPPVLTSLRVENQQRVVSSTLSRNSTATLWFSSVDLDRFGYGDVAREKTMVSFRAHTPDQATRLPWTPLQTVIAGDDLDEPALFTSPAGVLFRTDLSSVTATIEGPVDVRLSVEDDSGNRVEYTMEPALVVLPSRRPPVSRP